MTECARWSVVLAVLWTAVPTLASEPVLRVSAPGPDANLVLNPDFELHSATAFTNWSASPQGYRVATGEGHNGTTALAVEASDETGWRGASQTLTLNRTEPTPIRVRGWSRAEGVTGGSDSGYCVYVDLIHTDGTPLWGQTANFGTGTHDWQPREVLIVPDKPVRSLSLYCLFRGHAGKAWFDEIRVEELGAGTGGVLFQGTPMERVPTTNAPPPITESLSTRDGLRLGIAGSRVLQVAIEGELLTSTDGVTGGFLARDVATDSDLYGFEAGLCPELGLRLDARFEARDDHVLVEGQVVDTRGVDRAILLVFALPVDLTGWHWDDDIRRSRTLEGRGEFANAQSIGCGTTGTLSTYPLGAIRNDRLGLALGLDLGTPAQYRIVAHAGTQQLFLAYDLGLVPDTETLPGGAKFRLVIYRFEPRWGFRAAFQRFTELFPDHFVVRSREQGIWMPFTDVSTVQGWEDFGFRYHEGNNNVPWDDAHGVLSFRYTEPMTWWMSMAPELPRTEAEALRIRDELAAGPAGSAQRMARVSQSTAMLDADGHPALLFRNEPWANGAVWSLNPNPHLPASPNAATVHWNETLKTQLYGPAANGRLDGEYLDSLEGYVTANLNFARDQFRYSTVPLTFATDTHRPALFKGLAVFEFTRWISDDVHRLGGLMFANGVPYRFGFLCPWLDVMGTETDWMSGDTFRPVSDAQLCVWRTLSGRKPYLLLMNTDYDRFTTPFVEQYFQRSLFYGMFPSMFSHNASENPYWRNPTWYNRDRPLFQRYLPIIRRVAEAGWQPVTGATTDDPALWVERFGPDAEGTVYFTLYQTGTEARTNTLRWERIEPALTPPGPATELMSGHTLERAGASWRVATAGGSTVAVRVEPGPRFVETQAMAEGKYRLTIASPVDFEHLLESSIDLRAWSVVSTNTPTTPSFTTVVDPGPAGPPRYYRLRW